MDDANATVRIRVSPAEKIRSRRLFLQRSIRAESRRNRRMPGCPRISDPSAAQLSSELAHDIRK
jgi:hypothetical protein